MTLMWSTFSSCCSFSTICQSAGGGQFSPWSPRLSPKWHKAETPSWRQCRSTWHACCWFLTTCCAITLSLPCTFLSRLVLFFVIAVALSLVNWKYVHGKPTIKNMYRCSIISSLHHPLAQVLFKKVASAVGSHFTMDLKRWRRTGLNTVQQVRRLNFTFHLLVRTHPLTCSHIISVPSTREIRFLFS